MKDALLSGIVAGFVWWALQYVYDFVANFSKENTANRKLKKRVELLLCENSELRQRLFEVENKDVK
jgi:cell shape-determining protein MreC